MFKKRSQKLITDLLPYVAYEEETGMYLNMDETIGFAWKSLPFVTSGMATNEVASLFSGIDIPNDSVLQFTLAAPDVFIISVKLTVTEEIEIEEALSIRDQLSKALQKMQLKPEAQTPQDFIDLTGNLFTGGTLQETYNDEQPIKTQCIPDQTEIELNWNELKFNNRVLNCLTPRLIREDVKDMVMGELTHNLFNIDPETSDTSYLHTVSLVFEKGLKSIKTAISKKVLKLVPYFSGSGTEPSGQAEVPFTVLSTLWTISPSANSAATAVNKIKRLLERNGITMHEEKELLTSLFVSALPFGLYLEQDFFHSMNRGFPSTWGETVSLLPFIQAKYEK